MNILDKLQDYLQKIDKIISTENEEIIKVFTIGNTRISSDMKVYFTPIRKHQNVISAGVIVFSEEEAEIIMSKIDGLFTCILIDSEKKSICTKENVGIFNLERLSYEIIKKSKIFRFKGNDLTTDSIEDFVHIFLARKGKLMGGANVFVIGLGNLGFKITLRLVELGMNVYVKNRTDFKINNLIDAINIIKPKETIASASKLEESKWQEVVPKLDFVILCTTSIVEDFDRYVNMLNKDIIILDVGKGCLSNNMVNYLRQKNIVVYRLDIGDALGQFIFGNVLNKRHSEVPRFRKLYDGSTLLTKGIVGLEGDIVVDDIDNPKFLYGVCNGEGSFINMDKKEEERVLNLIL
jgi:hypothetical protein